MAMSSNPEKMRATKLHGPMAIGVVDVKPLITDHFSLEDVMVAHEASQDLSTYKILVKP